MTDNNHPITPPPELVQAFLRSNPVTPDGMTYEEFIATRFARWGADQEVGACCQWLSLKGYDLVAAKFRDARRPKPPSLKEQALMLLEPIGRPHAEPGAWKALRPEEVDIIRRALESLHD